MCIRDRHQPGFLLQGRSLLRRLFVSRLTQYEHCTPPASPSQAADAVFTVCLNTRRARVEKVRLRRPFPPGCAIRLLSRRLCRQHLANIGVLRAGRAQPLYLLTPAGRFGPSAQVPTGHTLPSGASGGRRKVALLAQGCRIRRACQRGRPPAGSVQPVPRSRGIPSPNRRFGEGTRDSDFSLESCGSPNL